jgi:hypothetical protein
MKIVGWAALGFVVFVGLNLLYSFVLNPVTQASRIVNKTIDADNVIYNYEWFLARSEAIKATDEKIRLYEIDAKNFKEELGPRETWESTDKDEFARLNTILSGLKSHREELVGEYNARSKMANRGIFKNLPELIQ